MFEGIKEAIHKEMDMLDEKYSKGTQLSDKDLADIDKMAHAMKCIVGYEMAEGESSYGGDSYARGRSRMTGRYVSRDGGYDSRDDGYMGRRY
jgi:hypothetical protein